ALEGGDLRFRADRREAGLVLRALAQVDGFELVGLADLLEQDMDADRADAGGVVAFHGFLAAGRRCSAVSPAPPIVGKGSGLGGHALAVPTSPSHFVGPSLAPQWAER